MDETKKKQSPDEEKEEETSEKPEQEKSEDKEADQQSDEKPKEDKPEEKSPDDKQADENGEGAPAEGKAEDDSKDEQDKSSPDDKDEEILRLRTQIAAMQLGVKPDCMEDVVAIAESYVKGGKAQDINSALSAVVKKYPDMKSDAEKSDGRGTGGFKVGADGSKDKKADNDRLSKAFGIRKKK